MLLSYRWGRSRSNVMLLRYPLDLPEIQHVLPVLGSILTRSVFQFFSVFSQNFGIFL